MNQLALYLNTTIGSDYKLFDQNTFNLELNKLSKEEIEEHFLEDLIDLDTLTPTKRLYRLVNEARNEHKDDPAIFGMPFILNIDHLFNEQN